MLHRAKRLSLVVQSHLILKDHIESAGADEQLPSERELCAKLGISRMTLRGALARLVDEGLIKGGQGKRHVIARERGSQKRVQASREVVVLSPLPLHGADPRVLFWMNELRDFLGREDYHLDFLHQRNCYGKSPGHALRELTARLKPAAWLLYLSTQAMQEWFAQNDLPAVIPGTRYGDVALPSVDVDYRAACRHAAGRFISAGHDRLALLNPRSPAGGDLESEAGFLEGGDGVETIILRHDGTPGGVCRCLDQLLARKRRPTAFLISRPTHALTALTHLIRRGVKFPGDAALIARDHDSFLEHVVPSVARYQVNPILYARKLSRVVLETASGNAARPRHHRIIPKLIAGATLGGS